MSSPAPLSLRDIERLENTSFATAFAGLGLDGAEAGVDEAERTTGCDPFRTHRLECMDIYGSGDVCIWVESECSCGCAGCDPEEAALFVAGRVAPGAEHETRLLLDVVRRG